MWLFDQVQEFQLSLRRSPSDTSQFDALYESIDMGAGLADRDYTPAQIAEDLPESRRFGIDGGKPLAFSYARKKSSRVPRPPTGF